MLQHFYHKHDNYSLTVYGANWRAQSFTPSGSFVCSSATLFFSSLGTPAGDLTYSIYAADGSGNPTGAALGSTIVDYSGVDTDNPGIPLTGIFTPGISLSASTQYVLVVSLSAGNGSNYLRLTNKASGDYAGGNSKSSANSGSTWSDVANDLLFDLWDSGLSGTREYLAIGNSTGKTRFMRLYRDTNGNSTVLWAYGIAATQTNCTVEKSDSYIYAVTSDSSNTYLDRWDAQLAKDGTFGQRALTGILRAIGISADDYIGHGYQSGTRGYYRVLNPGLSVVYSGGGAVSYHCHAMKISGTEDFLLHGYGNGSGGSVNGYRRKKTDGTNLLNFWVSAGQMYGMTIRESDKNAFCAAVISGIATVREYLDDSDSYVWTTNMSPYGGLPFQVVHDPDLDLLYVGTDRTGGNNTSLYKLNAATGAQVTTYDTGGNVRKITITRDGTILVCGPSSTDAGTQVSSLREFDSNLNVLWRFDENFTMNLGGVVEPLINYVNLPFTVEGSGSLFLIGPKTKPPGGTPGDPIAVGASSPVTGVYPIVARPESPVIEHLLFRTRITRALDGSEVRTPMRLAPRLAFEMKIADKRQVMESILYDRAMDYMASPFWHEAVWLTQPAYATQDTVQVTTTAQSEFVEGQWALVLSRSMNRYDLVEIDTVADTEITFTSSLLHSYPVKAEVIPVSRCLAENIQVDKRLERAVYDMKVLVDPLDNDLGLTLYADDALEITEVNYVSNSLRETISRPHYRSDGGTGLIYQSVILDHSDKGSMVGFRTNSRASLWALREMLYRLAGRCVSFKLATFGKELTPAAPLVSGNTTLTIENCGYTNYVQNRRGTIRVILTDGTVVSRTVTGSVVLNYLYERLTVSVAWGATMAVADVARIEYLDSVRFDTDDITIRHANALGWTSCDVPIKLLG